MKACHFFADMGGNIALVTIYFKEFNQQKYEIIKLVKPLFFGLLLCLLVFSCAEDKLHSNNSSRIEVTGTIQKQGITSYQYGTHIIEGYALRSSAVILDDYIDQKVTVVGHKIDGYPLSGGPDFLEVEAIK